MIYVASNQFYELSVDPEKNRMYLKITGTWEDFEEPQQYVADMEKTVLLLKPGFTVLTDAREMEPCSLEVDLIHQQAIQISKSAGLAEAAEIVSPNKMVVLQNEHMMKRTQVPYNFFDAAAEAEKWLDEFTLLHNKRAKKASCN